MFAIIAAFLFGFALLLQIIGDGLPPLFTVATLTTAGLLCVALHLAGAGTALRSRRRRR